jgi:tetratricopeptide (TPR) repeat protein
MSYDRALILVNQSRYDLAEQQLRRSVQENPEHAWSHALLAICLAHLKRPVEALGAANEGLRLSPTLAYTHYARACVLAKAAQSKQARKDVEEAIQLDPTRSEYFFLLSAIHSDQRRPKESLAAAERGLQLDPIHTGCASLRALSLQRLGWKEEAAAVIAQALMLDPNNDFTHTAQGWRLLEKKDRKAARQHFLEALRVNPENRWAASGLQRLELDKAVIQILTLCGASAALHGLAFAINHSVDPKTVLLVGGAGALMFVALAVVAANLLSIHDWMRWNYARRFRIQNKPPPNARVSSTKTG